MELPIATTLKHLREHAGLTQLALSEKSGVPLNTIRSFEQGLRLSPNVHTLARLADALGVSLDELVGRGSPT